MEVYRKTFRLLRQEDNSIQHHTFLFAEERDLHVVLRGIGFKLPSEEVLQNLQALGFQPIKILRMRHPVSKSEMPLLLVVLPKHAKSREIYNLKEICDIIVKVEALKALLSSANVAVVSYSVTTIHNASLIAAASTAPASTAPAITNPPLVQISTALINAPTVAQTIGPPTGDAIAPQ